MAIEQPVDSVAKSKQSFTARHEEQMANKSDDGSVSERGKDKAGSDRDHGQDEQEKKTPNSKRNKEAVVENDKEKPLEVAPQRKTKVRCTAMNDDEDFGGLCSAVQDAAERKASHPAVPVENGKEGAKEPPMKKEKEFAWMDSDEEGDDAKDDAKEDEEEDKEEDDIEITAEVLEDAQSFGRMIMLGPSLQKWLRADRKPEDVVAVCKALARTKFFDGDIIADLYSTIRTLLRLERLDVNQTNEVICCFRILNAYDRTVFGAIARAFRSKTRLMELAIRKTWLEIFQSFKHEGGDDFLQMLEVPPLLPNSPSYKRIRCAHFTSGKCVLEGSCTFSHDLRAPLTLADGVNEDWWRSKPLVMTQNQKTMGAGVYGQDRNQEKAPAGWSMPQGMQGGPASPVPGLTPQQMAAMMAMAAATGQQQMPAGPLDLGLQQLPLGMSQQPDLGLQQLPPGMS